MQEPVRCYNCQRLGHTRVGCTAPPRCLICSERHLKEACTSQIQKCANCGGPHKANSKECHLIRRATEVEQLKATEGLTHVEAREQVMERDIEEQQYRSDNRDTRRQHIVHAEVHPPPPSINIRSQQNTQYRNKLTGKRDQHEEIKYRTCSTQTEDTLTGREKTEENSFNVKEFFVNLTKCLTELFQANLTRENAQAREKQIQSAVLNNFALRDKTEEIIQNRDNTEEIQDSSEDETGVISSDTSDAESATAKEGKKPVKVAKQQTASAHPINIANTSKKKYNRRGQNKK